MKSDPSREVNDERSQSSDDGLLSGFEGYYRPSGASRQKALRAGVIVFDANALLDLYRFSPASRTEFLKVIAAVAPRSFVPYQVALEFHSNRVATVASRAAEFEQQRQQLAGFRSQATGVVRQVSRRLHGRDEASQALLDRLNQLFADVDDFVGAAAASYDLDPAFLAGSPPDDIVRALDNVFQGRVATRPAADLLAVDMAEGTRRIELGLPPGFRDAKKKAPLGDYLWWAEVVRYAVARHPEAVVIVSNDVAKGDWTLDIHGLRIGPRPELVAEMLEEAAAELHWMTTSEFLTEAAQAAVSTVSAGTLEEAQSQSVDSVTRAIRECVALSASPVVSSAVANAALAADPTLAETGWAGFETFRLFLAANVPELQFVIPPSPGYVLDPNRHVASDIPRLRSDHANRTAERSNPRADASRDSSTPLPPEMLEQIGRMYGPSSETLEQIGRMYGPSPETLEQIARMYAPSPELLEQIGRMYGPSPETLERLRTLAAAAVAQAFDRALRPSDEARNPPLGTANEAGDTEDHP